MPIIGKFQRKQKKEVPAWIGFQATAGDNTLHLRAQAAGYDCTIDWGDGTKTTAPVNGGNVVHNYAVAGLYDIKIRGKSFAGFYVNNQTGKEKYVAAYSMGKWEVDTLTNCTRCFNGCNNLISISENLFKYNARIKDFNGCFKDCTSLHTIPADLFRYNTATTIFTNVFNGCTTLTALPVDLLRYNIAVTDFSYCFTSCTALTAIPADLFRYNTEVLDFNSCFYDCSLLSTIPTDLFRYNTAVTNFDRCFQGCTALTLRADIFGIDYANRFNGKTVSFAYCFARISFTGTQGTAPALWSFVGLTANQYFCFGGGGNSTASLSNYSSIPSGWE